MNVMNANIKTEAITLGFKNHANCLAVLHGEDALFGSFHVQVHKAFLETQNADPNVDLFDKKMLEAMRFLFAVFSRDTSREGFAQVIQQFHAQKGMDTVAFLALCTSGDVHYHAVSFLFKAFPVLLRVSNTPITQNLWSSVILKLMSQGRCVLEQRMVDIQQKFTAGISRVDRQTSKFLTAFAVFVCMAADGFKSGQWFVFEEDQLQFVKDAYLVLQNLASFLRLSTGFPDCVSSSINPFVSLTALVIDLVGTVIKTQSTRMSNVSTVTDNSQLKTFSVTPEPRQLQRHKMEKLQDSMPDTGLGYSLTQLVAEYAVEDESGIDKWINLLTSTACTISQFSFPGQVGAPVCLSIAEFMGLNRSSVSGTNAAVVLPTEILCSMLKTLTEFGSQKAETPQPVSYFGNFPRSALGLLAVIVQQSSFEACRLIQAGLGKTLSSVLTKCCRLHADLETAPSNSEHLQMFEFTEGVIRQALACGEALLCVDDASVAYEVLQRCVKPEVWAHLVENREPDVFAGVCAFAHRITVAIVRIQGVQSRIMSELKRTWIQTVYGVLQHVVKSFGFDGAFANHSQSIWRRSSIESVCKFMVSAWTFLTGESGSYWGLGCDLGLIRKRWMMSPFYTFSGNFQPHPESLDFVRLYVSKLMECQQFE